MKNTKSNINKATNQMLDEAWANIKTIINGDDKDVLTDAIKLGEHIPLETSTEISVLEDCIGEITKIIQNEIQKRNKLIASISHHVK